MTHPLWLKRFVRVLIWAFALVEERHDEICDSRDCAGCMRKRMKRKVAVSRQ